MMFMGRALRIPRLLALITAGALAFTQLALAGFACPIGGTPQAMHAAMEDGHCDKVPDAGSKTLCSKTCQDEPQKHDMPAVDALPPAPDTGLRIQAPQMHLALAALPPRPDRRHATGPPPHLQYARFLK